MTSERREHLQNLIVALMAVLVLAAALAVAPGCRKPVTWTGGAITCATDGVRNNWGRIYPEVQNCLVVVSIDPIQCLDAIPTILEVGVDVVACIVRGTGQEAAAQYNRNPDDIVSARKAERANTWIKAKGFEFQE